MSEKQMTLEGLVQWMDDNDVSYEIDDAGKLTVKGDCERGFRDWVSNSHFTGLPDELKSAERNFDLEDTDISDVGGIVLVGVL